VPLAGRREDEEFAFRAARPVNQLGCRCRFLERLGSADDVVEFFIGQSSDVDRLFVLFVLFVHGWHLLSASGSDGVADPTPEGGVKLQLDAGVAVTDGRRFDVIAGLKPFGLAADDLTLVIYRPRQGPDL
jgi:hypothetical protein